ncbi:MAG: hypothetical protein DRG78_16370 [Epsilonproteobacteria bacterium]|nr:MAG: hypothetical protein DRG78_16370 [Campylobacterota bacterium]
MKNILLNISILIAISSILLAKQTTIEDLSYHDLAYLKSGNNVCTPSSILLKDTYAQIKKTFIAENAQVISDMRNYKGLEYVEIQYRNLYYIFYNSLETCVKQRRQSNLLNLPFIEKEKEKVFKNLSTSYFNYRFDNGNCYKFKNPKKVKENLLLDNPKRFKPNSYLIMQLDTNKGILYLQSDDIYWISTKTIEECLAF